MSSPGSEARAEDVEVLRREPIVAVFAASACLPAGPVSAERLARMPLAHLRQSKATEALLDAWRGETCALDVRLRSEDPLTVLRLIASGRAVGVMPELQLEGYTAGVQTRALEPALARELVLVAPHDRKRRPVADDFAAACRRVLSASAVEAGPGHGRKRRCVRLTATEFERRSGDR